MMEERILRYLKREEIIELNLKKYFAYFKKFEGMHFSLRSNICKERKAFIH